MSWEPYLYSVEPNDSPYTPLASRLSSFEGARVGVLFNHKPKAQVFLNIVARELQARYGAADVIEAFTEALTTPASEEVISKLTLSVDVVLVGMGDSGSPSLLVVHDAIAVERKGVPSIPFCTTPFVDGDMQMARMRGVPELRMAVVEHPINVLNEAQLRARALEVLPTVVTIATAPASAS